MITMNEVTKIYESSSRSGWFRSRTERERTAAVDSLSLTLAPGEIIGLLGLNGAGKTTTIRMLSTLLSPTSGSIEIDGLSMQRSRKEIQRRVNMIAGGERMLYWRLTGRENLRYFGRLYGLGGGELGSRVETLLGEVGLSEAGDRPVEQYSKGMKQRLQIARGLINDPSYLFLDEPTLGLDAPIARQLRGMIRSMAAEQGKGILLTSHYLQEVEELCDRVYVLDRGKLLMCESPQRIVSRIAGGQTAHIEFTGWTEAIAPELLVYLERLDLAEPSSLSALRAELGSPAPRTGGADPLEPVALAIRTPAAEELIGRLLPWASAHGLSITGFRTEKPTLEDAIVALSEERAS